MIPPAEGENRTLGFSSALNKDPPSRYSILEIAGSRPAGPQLIEPLKPEADWSMEISVAGERIHRVVKRRGEREPIEDQRDSSPADLAYLRGLKARFLHFERYGRRSPRRPHGQRRTWQRDQAPWPCVGALRARRPTCAQNGRMLDLFIADHRQTHPVRICRFAGWAKGSAGGESRRGCLVR